MRRFGSKQVLRYLSIWNLSNLKYTLLTQIKLMLIKTWVYFAVQHGTPEKKRKNVFELHIVFLENGNFLFIFDTFKTNSFATAFVRRMMQYLATGKSIVVNVLLWLNNQITSLVPFETKTKTNSALSVANLLWWLSNNHREVFL